MKGVQSQHQFSQFHYVFGWCVLYTAAIKKAMHASIPFTCGMLL